jgi:hypothetical protein
MAKNVSGVQASRNTKPSIARGPTTSIMPSYRTILGGHCRYFIQSRCRFGDSCYYPHDEAVKTAFVLQKVSTTRAKQHNLAVANPTPDNTSGNTPLPGTPMAQKCEIAQGILDTSRAQVEGHYPTPPPSPKDLKPGFGHEYRGTEVTPPTTPVRKVNRPAGYQTAYTAETVNHAGRVSWDTHYRSAQTDESGNPYPPAYTAETVNHAARASWDAHYRPAQADSSDALCKAVEAIEIACNTAPTTHYPHTQTVKSDAICKAIETIETASNLAPASWDETDKSDTLCQAAETAETVNNAARASWDTHYRPVIIDETVTQLFEKIYAASIKVPKIALRSRRSHNNNFDTLAEAAEAALLVARKQRSYSEDQQPTFTGEKSANLQAAEGYKKALLAGKIPNVLSKAESAKLDVIIASQYWEAPIQAIVDNTGVLACQTPKSITNTPDYWTNQIRSNSKNWGPNDYMVWAKHNLTDATAIKLARTYSDHLENGTAPMRLFSRRGEQATPGQSFKDFSLLPYELREQIWLMALENEKNDVRLVWQREEHGEGHFTNNSFFNANNQQRLLFVSRECRELAIKHNYELAFGTRHSSAQTYFDFKRDRLFIHTSHTNELYDLVKFLRTKDVERIQNLAIPLRDFLQGDEHKIARALCRFKNVKMIHLVCGDGLEDVTYCRAGSARLAKNIQRFLYNTWRKHNDPNSWPKVRMYTIPAMIAQLFKIDNLVY